jgi:hypothetical protein
MSDQLSEMQETLIEYLKSLNYEQETILLIMLLIPKDAELALLAQYLLENPQATDSDIIQKAMDILELENDIAD